MTGERQKKSSKNGISYLRTAELEKFANTLRNKKQYGGNHQVSGVEESWDLVNNLLNNSAPIDLGPPRQVGGKRKSNKKSYSLYGGGEESSGATFLPAQWNSPKAPLPKGNNPNQIDGAYGRINAVSGMDVNLSAFPNSSMQQTGGAKKKKEKKVKKSTDSSKDKPATKKAKKAKKSKKTTDSPKKSTSIWAKIKSFF
jgi:hypothetical protein